MKLEAKLYCEVKKGDWVYRSTGQFQKDDGSPMPGLRPDTLCIVATATASSPQRNTLWTTLLGLTPFRDGDMWCVRLGTDLQSGIAGFGNTPAAAIEAFERAMYAPIQKSCGLIDTEA